MSSKVASVALLTGFLLSQGSSENLHCDVKASYACFWGTSMKFTNVADDAEDFVIAACAVAEELPTENKCEALYVGCPEDAKRQFSTMEIGYESLQNITTDNRTCISRPHQSTCDDSSRMKNCSDTGITAAAATFEDRVYSRQRSAERFRTCMLNADMDCSHILRAGRALRLLRVINAVVDLNTPLNVTVPPNSSHKKTLDSWMSSVVTLIWLMHCLT